MNVKIGAGNLKTLQKAALEVIKQKPSETKKSGGKTISDLKEISSDSKNLKNVDAQKSILTLDQYQIDFNIVFSTALQQVVNAKGYISKEENSLEVHFTFEYDRKIFEDKKEIVRKFKVDIHLKAYYEESISLERKIEKEDIFKFVQRVVSEVFDTFNDEKKSLRAVFIDKNNLKKITGIRNGEIAGLIHSLMGAVFSLAKYKEANTPRKIKTPTPQNLNKEKWEMKNFIMTNVEIFTLEINQVEDEGLREK